MSARKTQAKLRAWIDAYKASPDQRLAYRIARHLFRLGFLSEAFRWAKHIKERYPSFPKGLGLYLKIKNRTIALSLKRAKRRAKAAPSAGNIARYCELLRVAGKLRRALRLARKADRDHAEDWQLQLVLGKLAFDRYSKSQNETHGWEAVEHLDKSRCLNPANYSTLILLSIALARLHSYEDALNVVDEGLQIAPRDQRALRLKRRVLKALEERAKQPTEAPDAPASETAESEFPQLRKVLEVHGAVGALIFDRKGKVAGRQVKENERFDFSAPPEVFQSMATACRLNTHRIGLGDLISCSLTGEGWNVVYHATADGPVLTFFDGDFTGEDVEAEVSEVLQQFESERCSEAVGATNA